MSNDSVQELNFVSIDVETANPDMASICQIGVAVVEGGKIVDEWQSLVDPQAFFDPRCVSVHGIRESDVVGAPTFAELSGALSRLLQGRVVVSHSGFDRTAVSRAYAAAEVPVGPITWLDSAMVVRRTWSQFSRGGYGLANVAQFLGIEFRHHDALEDAKAAAQVVIRAADEQGGGLERLQELVRRAPASRSAAQAKNPEPNPEGPLFGELIVFTGSLAIPRAEAKAMAAELGCQVKGSVTKNTSMLVVGDQDISRLAGKEKSEKHLKAEALMEKGAAIRVLKESDFFAMVESEVTA